MSAVSTDIKIHIEITGKGERASLTVIYNVEDSEVPEIPMVKLYTALSESGISVGINNNVLEDISTNRRINEKLIVAEFSPPEVGEDAKLKLVVKQKERLNHEHAIESEEKIDHYGEKEGFITFVRKGDVLATKLPPTRGKDGFKVNGETIKGIWGKDLDLKYFLGYLTEIKDNDIIASEDGIFKRKKNKLHVEKVLQIDGDIGLKTGSIILPLESNIELIIPGDIKSGFLVQCSGITVRGTIEDAKVTAHRLDVKSGIVGTSDIPIEAQYLKTNFIIGPRKINAKFIDVRSEVSGGTIIQTDFLRAKIVQECSVIAKYGVWAKYLYGKNDILVGVNIGNKEEYNNWREQLKQVNNEMLNIQTKNKNLLRKAESIKKMAQAKSVNPVIKKEIKKLSAIVKSIGTLNNLKYTLEQQIDEYKRNMYVDGSAFILVESGFSKKGSKSAAEDSLNKLAIKKYSYNPKKSQTVGLYSLTEDENEVVVNNKYNVVEINRIVDKYLQKALQD